MASMSELRTIHTDRDLDADALYVTLLDAPIGTTEELPDGIIVDLTDDGDLIGIEVLSVSRGWNTQALLDRFDLNEATTTHLAYLARTPATVTRPAAATPSSAGQGAPGRVLVRTA